MGAAGRRCEHKGRRMRQLASVVWLHCLVRGERKKKKYFSQFFSWVILAAIETAARWLVCPHEACESRCDGVAGVPAKGGGGDDAMTVVLLACSGSEGGNGSNSAWWLSGALSHATD